MQLKNLHMSSVSGADRQFWKREGMHITNTKQTHPASTRLKQDRLPNILQRTSKCKARPALQASLVHP